MHYAMCSHGGTLVTRGWDERWLGWVSPLLLLALWEGATRAGWLNAQFFPPPSAIAGTFAALAQDGTLTTHLTATLGRLLLGFLAGALPAVLFGLVLGLSRPLRLIVLPIANVLYTIPKIAILPLVLLVLGLGEASKIAITAISVFFLVLLNTVAGVLGIERRYLDVARNFGAGRLQVYRTVALPGALPLILTGCKLGMGFALIVVVGTEFVVSGARTGVGVLLWESWQVLNIEAMYVGLVLTAVLGWALNLVLDEVEVRLVPWRQTRRVGSGQWAVGSRRGVREGASAWPSPHSLLIAHCSLLGTRRHSALSTQHSALGFGRRGRARSRPRSSRWRWGRRWRRRPASSTRGCAC